MVIQWKSVGLLRKKKWSRPGKEIHVVTYLKALCVPEAQVTCKIHKYGDKNTICNRKTYMQPDSTSAILLKEYFAVPWWFMVLLSCRMSSLSLYGWLLQLSVEQYNCGFRVFFYSANSLEFLWIFFVLFFRFLDRTVDFIFCFSNPVFLSGLLIGHIFS